MAIEIHPKEPWQKEDCISHGCQNTSTQVAREGTVSIRCCTEPACVQHAANLVVQWQKAIRGAGEVFGIEEGGGE